MQGGMVYANAITTVSPTYAREVLEGGAAGWLRDTLSRTEVGWGGVRGCRHKAVEAAVAAVAMRAQLGMALSDVLCTQPKQSSTANEHATTTRRCGLMRQCIALTTPASLLQTEDTRSSMAPHGMEGIPFRPSFCAGLPL